MNQQAKARMLELAEAYYRPIIFEKYWNDFKKSLERSAFVAGYKAAVPEKVESAEDLLHEIVRGDSAKGIELELLNRARKLLSKAANK